MVHWRGSQEDPLPDYHPGLITRAWWWVEDQWRGLPPEMQGTIMAVGILAVWWYLQTHR